jgi:toxin ParE1/3/4
MLEIVFRPSAETDILGIATYSKLQFGEAQAKRYIDEIYRQIANAAEFPGIGSKAVDLPPSYRKVKSGSHRVIYRHTEQDLIVVRILRDHQDVPDEWDDF